MLPLVLASLLSMGQGLEPKMEFPKAGQPGNFSFAAGSYEMSVRAGPLAVQVEEPIALTVKITSLVPGLAPYPPERGKLRLFPPGFEDNFFIEAVPEDDRRVDDKSWEFVYRVFPRDAAVREIPALQFVYYQTAGEPKYQAVDSAPIGIEVKPWTMVQMGSLAALRARMHPLAGRAWWEGEPSPGVLVPAFVLPPLLCICGLFLWQRLFPDAALQARLQRSRALRHALKQLRRLGAQAPAASVAAIVVQYLRARFDLKTAEPTPLEIRKALATAGLSPEVAEAAEQFARGCDAERFAPELAGRSGHQAAEATRLLQKLETSLAAGHGDGTAPRQTGSDSDLFPSSSRAWLALLLVGLPAAVAVASDGNRWFQQGIAVENDGMAARRAFARAARAYQEQIDKGDRDPELFRRLGDAYLLADDLPHAIFAYRRGLKEAPQVQALWDHLELARDRVPYPNGEERERPAASEWQSWLPRPSPVLLLGAAAMFHGLAWIALARWWLRRQSSTLAWVALWLTAMLAMLGSWRYEEWRHDRENRQAFVVVAYNNMTLRRGNGTMYPPQNELPTVHRGMEARLLHERGDWVQLEFPGGEVGWLPRRAVLLDGTAG